MKIFDKKFTPYCFSHQFLQLASRTRFLKNIQVYVFLKNLFTWLASFFFGEGASLNKPPLFCGKNYQLWCIRMKFFIESLDKEIWNVISNNVFMHMPENNSASSKNEINHLDCIAKNVIVSALDSDELLKVSKCISTKEMWDTLEKYHKNPRSA